MAKSSGGKGKGAGSEKKTVHRSSVNGKFVTEEYAKKHPKITEKEKVNTGK